MYLIGINYDNIWNFEKKKQASPWQKVVSVKTIIYAYLRWMMAVHFDNNHRYFTNVFWEHIVISILVDDRPKHKIWCILYTKRHMSLFQNNICNVSRISYTFYDTIAHVLRNWHVRPDPITVPTCSIPGRTAQGSFSRKKCKYMIHCNRQTILIYKIHW